MREKVSTILAIKFLFFLILIFYSYSIGPLTFRYSIFSNGKEGINFFFSIIVVGVLGLITTFIEIKKLFETNNKNLNLLSVSTLGVIEILSVFLLFNQYYVLLVFFINLIPVSVLGGSQAIFNFTFPIIYILPSSLIIIFLSIIIQENFNKKNNNLLYDNTYKKNKEVLVLIFNNGRVVRLKLHSLLEIADLIINKAGKNHFVGLELQKTYDLVIKDYRSNLSKNQYRKINSIIQDFVENGGTIEFE